MMATVKKVFPFTLIIAGVLVGLALVGSIVLLCLGHTVPTELWGVVVAGMSWFVGGAAHNYTPGKLPSDS
jgi:hypothetical protein